MARRGSHDRRDTGDEATPVCAFCGRGEGSVTTLIAGPAVHICDACVRECTEILDRDAAVHRALAGVPPPRDIHAFLDDYVIGQQHAKRVLAVAVHNHFKRIRAGATPGGVDIGKSNVLLVGPPGCGKTLLVETLSRRLEVPLVTVDATTLTEAGYVGEGVEVIAERLFRAAHGDAGLAARGIVYIDEIDKLAVRRSGPGRGRDIGGEGVQQALLTLMEGQVVPVGDRHGDTAEVDTREVLFIAGGAFNGLEEAIRTRVGGSEIGFIAAPWTARSGGAATLVDLMPEDLVRFGFIPELVGRLPVTAVLQALSEQDLIRLLTEPRNAPTRQYRALMRSEGCSLEFTAGALRAIAREALALGGGARGLRAILERVLLEPMFEAPGKAPGVLRIGRAQVTGSRAGRRRLSA